MSDYFLRIIPVDPNYIPEISTLDGATEYLQDILSVFDSVETSTTKEIRFIDQGSNFESVNCPRCGSDISIWWSQEIDRAAKKEFCYLNVLTPCCESDLSLNSLDYHWPAGFARFVLEVQNPTPGKWLERDHVSKLEDILGCDLRQIMSHY